MKRLKAARGRRKRESSSPSSESAQKADQNGHSNNTVTELTDAKDINGPEQSLLVPKKLDAKNGIDSVDGMTADQRLKLQSWATSFRRVDPRFQILNFFNNVAQQDANDRKKLEKIGVKSLPYISYKAKQNPIVGAAMRSLNDEESVISENPRFKDASCFSVWRPTSREAIRYMMLGSAVGKGLDIKGKSAKKGRLSAFVPFLQIHKDEHIPNIRIRDISDPKSAIIRIFFSSETKQLHVKDVLEEVQKEIQGTVGVAIPVINDYAPKCYGLSVPEKVLWEGLVVRCPTGISRDPGTVGEPYVTGRPSVPQFQDMNLDAFRKPFLPHTPRLVLWQKDDEEADVDNPCNPLTLLMAYEESKFSRVLPVVSDLDCFLIGTRGVNYEEPLPKDQQKVLKWSVDRIEGILEGQKGGTWTQQWLDVLKVSASKYGFHPKIPALGFSDPKTKLIMKNAIDRLSATGAVRHGAECFNFYFPQDLDDQFLVISDYLPGQDLSWTYVDTYGLMGILAEKLDLGYTFPLNPKWVLCDDPGWKILWDKLMVSEEARTRGALEAWYPKDIRAQIERVCQTHPHGFFVPETSEAASAPAAASPANDDDISADMDAEMAMELANYELIQYLIDLDKEEKQREKDRRNAAQSQAVKSSPQQRSARPGVSQSYDDVAAAKRSYRRDNNTEDSKSQENLKDDRSVGPNGKSPGVYTSYDDVAAAKQSYSRRDNTEESKYQDNRRDEKPAATNGRNPGVYTSYDDVAAAKQSYRRDTDDSRYKANRNDDSSAASSAKKPGVYTSYDDVAAAKQSYRRENHGEDSNYKSNRNDDNSVTSSAKKPGVYTSYEDVAAAKESYARREQNAEGPKRPQNDDHSVVDNVKSLVQSLPAAPDVLVDLLSTSMNEHPNNEPMQLYAIEQLSNLLDKVDKGNTKAVLVENHVDVNTILGMKTFGETLAIQEQGCRLLWLLSDETGGGNMINATSRIVAVSRIVEALKWFIAARLSNADDGTEFVRFAFGALGNLLLDKKAGKIFKSLDGGQNVVVEALSLFPQNMNIQLDGVSVLGSSSSLPEDEELSSKMVDGVVNALLEHFATCESEGRSVAAAGSRALSKWTDQEERLSLLENHPKLPQLKLALTYIVENSGALKCRKKASNVLERLGGGQLPESKPKKTAARKNSMGSHSEMPIDEALSILERENQLSEDAAKVAFDALIQQFKLNTTSSCERLLRKNGVTLICQTMKAYDQSIDVQDRGCFLLNSMTKIQPKRVLASGQACYALLHAISCHKNSNTLQRVALSAIHDLSSDFDCWFQIQQTGQMDFLQELIYNTEDAEAAELAICILTNFTNFGM